MGFSLESLFNPGQVLIDTFSGKDSSSAEAFNYISDPMDLFGRRAKGTREDISAIDMQAALDAVLAQEQAYNQNVALQQPFYDYGLGSLQQLQNFELSPFSQTFYDQAAVGENSIARSQASRGKLNSSQTFDLLGGFYNDLTGDEVNRQRQGLIDNINIAQGSSNAIGGASNNYSQNASGIYNNLGVNSANNIMNFGDSRARSYQQGSNLLGGVGYYAFK